MRTCPPTAWPVFRFGGLYNRNRARAEALAKEYGIGEVFDDLPKAIAAAGPETIFDVALPASMFAGVLRQLPEGAHVLLQKPMGESLAEAREIVRICRERKLRARSIASSALRPLSWPPGI